MTLRIVPIVIVTTVEAIIRFIGIAVGPITGTTMFGKRFSISACTLAVAGACSVLLSSSETLAQGYQQTNFPRYAGQRLSELSAAATRPPMFSDAPNDSTAMSPNSWGESAISNPHAGYANSTTPASDVPPSLGNQLTSPARQSGVDANQQDIFAPSTLNLNALSTVKNDPNATGLPLTNTEHSRSQMQANPFKNAGFSKDKEAELSKAPELPEVKFPFTRQKNADSFDQIPFDIQPQEQTQEQTQRLTDPTATDHPLFNTPPETILENDLDQSTADLEVPSTLEGSATAARAAEPSVDQFFETPNPTEPRVQPPLEQQQFQQPSQPLPQQTQSRLAVPSFEQSLLTPAQHQPQHQLPTQPQFQPSMQPAYFERAPHYAPRSSGPISNQWGYGYPESGQAYGQPHVESPVSIYDHGFGMPNYRQNIAQRSALPMQRNQTILDQGQSFDFETKKKEFPPFGEIIATGRFFGSVELALLRPHFLGNTAISIDGPTFSESIPFEFDNETAPHARFGFESKYGPGFELDYFTLNANSDPISETFRGVAPVTTIASITGPNRFTQLSADAIGETLNANHSFEIETFGFNVFKDIGFKVSRIGGRFGFTYANIAQSLEASVTDGGGNILDTLQSTSDFRGFGPKFGIDYYRPVGHTPLEFITSFSGTGLFGRRDQFVNNTAGLVERRFGADEFVTVLDLTSGIQYKKTIAENRAWFARLAFVHQTWLGGATAVDPQGDFGMKGITFGVGYNR